VLTQGTRLGYAELAMAAQVGRANISVFTRPRVAVLSTGDEVVDLKKRPGPFQIRNSNSVSLAAQATLAGAEPVSLGNAPDRKGELRAMIERGLDEDILVLSGGVSMGKYDLVEDVLRALGAEIFFDAVAIRPGRPAVFGVCRKRFVFGLPGNPVSTMVTFELLVVPAIDILSGMPPRPLATFKAKLAGPVVQKAVLTHFLPARVTWPEGEATVEELPWQGSGDIVALGKANCFLVVPETKLTAAAGEWVDVLPRRGTF
jgi:molybdopterin molybdotransferase